MILFFIDETPSKNASLFQRIERIMNILLQYLLNMSSIWDDKALSCDCKMKWQYGLGDHADDFLIKHHIFD